MRLLAIGLFLAAFVSQAHADIARFDQVTPGIFRGGQPEDERDYQFLKSLGIKTIVSFRAKMFEKKERKSVEKLGMKFISIPLDGFFSPSDKDVNKILGYMTHPSYQPIFIHCHYGKDRTGLLVGLYRVKYQRWTKEQAYQEMRSYGFSPLLLGLVKYFWDSPDPYDFDRQIKY